MKNYILLLPIIFIFHDMEEIVGFERFLKNPDIFVRFPSIICLHISIVVLNNCAGYIEFRFIDAVGSVVAIIAMMVNLRLAHKLMDFYNKKLNLYNL